jgi:hypothetical protein
LHMIILQQQIIKRFIIYNIIIIIEWTTKKKNGWEQHEELAMREDNTWKFAEWNKIKLTCSHWQWRIDATGGRGRRVAPEWR